jgi:hypothetical protein
VIAPAGPFTTLDEVVRWTRDASGGQCADARTATTPELASNLGADRARLYEPFVAAWATCAVPPFAKVGLVLVKPDGVRELQEAWKAGLADGTPAENPDFAFGDGFAITSEELGAGELGLRHLWCEPVGGTDAAPDPAGVEAGCSHRPGATTDSGLAHCARRPNSPFTRSGNPPPWNRVGLGGRGVRTQRWAVRGVEAR